MSILSRVAYRLVDTVAQKVAKNHLFEQEGERQKQAPIALEKPTEQQETLVQPASNDVIEEAFLGVRVINHWATWCDPCVEELPLLEQLQKKIGKEKILGISWDLFQGGDIQDVCDQVEAMQKQYHLDYKTMLVLSSPEDFFQRFELDPQTVPQTMVFSEDYDLVFHCKEGLEQDDIDTIVSFVNGGE